MITIDVSGMPQLKVGVTPRLVIAKSDPQLIWTRRGYAPVIEVEDVHKGEKYLLYVSAYSLAEPLEKHRQGKGTLVGTAILLRKQSVDAMSKYEVSFED